MTTSFESSVSQSPVFATRSLLTSPPPNMVGATRGVIPSRPVKQPKDFYEYAKSLDTVDGVTTPPPKKAKTEQPVKRKLLF